MAELSPIPNWFLSKITYAGGVRQPKMEKWKPIYKPYRGFVPLYQQKRETPNALINSDYRYWGSSAAFRYSGDMGSCRACRANFFAKDSRAEHMLKNNCRSLLERAYKRLKREQCCLICGQPTRKKKWGLPFCTEACIDNWMYYNVQPQSLYKVLEEVRKEDMPNG